MASRSAEIRAEKAKATNHEMGNVVNVSPFGQDGDPKPVAYSVHSTCRKCGRGMYIQKNGDVVKSWGDALVVACG